MAILQAEEIEDQASRINALVGKLTWKGFGAKEDYDEEGQVVFRMYTVRIITERKARPLRSELKIHYVWRKRDLP